MKNVFIEGLQGCGKSTFLIKLAKRFPKYKVYYEGDISPVELKWCSRMTKEQFEKTLKEYTDFKDEIFKYTLKENNYYITAYTRILTDTRAFYDHMESFEIYNGKVNFETFKNIIYARYEQFDSIGNLFECSFFQNSIESMMLYYELSNEVIIEFYKKAFEILKYKEFKMFYLDSDKILENILHIKKERSDNQGHEMWYPLMINYLKQSPCGRTHNYKGLDDLVCHLEKRREIEHRVIKEILKDTCVVIVAKDYDIEKLNISI